MAYAKQTWANGDIITAEKMNHIEDGIESTSSGGITIANIAVSSMTTGTCDYTYQELMDKVNNGETVLFQLIGFLSGPAYAGGVYSDVLTAAGVGVYASQVKGFTIEYDTNGLRIALGE